jgi:probable phosphoglycerate mutase
VKLPTIILLRHGETLWNVEGRYQGKLNSDLTLLGREQSKQNALKISNLINIGKPFKILSSPLGRAKESTLIICATLGIDNKKIVFDKNIQEISYGIFEGKTKEFCQNNYKELYEAREVNKWSYLLEGAESYEMVKKRLYLCLEELKNEKLVIVVAHEMINRVLRGIYCDYSHNKILTLRQANDIVFKLENSIESIIE